MLLKRLLLAAAVAAASLPAGAAARSAPAYKGAIATDASTGAVLFEDNADAVSPPASMTKLMTYAVLCDEMRKGALSLDTKVTVTYDDAKVGLQRDSTVVWLRQGEVFPVEELIYAMFIHSANDAAYALAHKAGGTVAAFVAMMNAKARELGMLHSTFRTPHGFPPPSRRIADGDLTTPRDYSVLCRYLLLHTDVLKYASVKNRPFGLGYRLQPVQMANHNHLLGKIPGVDGLKTGFTSGAGFCLAATAQRDGRRVIVVMMDSPDPTTRDLNVRDLLTRVFAELPLGGKPFERAQDGAAAPAADLAAPTPAPPSAPDAGPVVRYPAPGGR
ncbi:MAG: D-alanyl-D-alanine carboxypeptidase family protein [Opitutaceae bacterium]|jgi:D-alanyl-D-alanine carboxypeptidase (penicillin-binding protein 5/6)